MRYPVAETAEKHTRILDQAAALFRRRGFSGVSVGEIMRATGLTHGPFYNHFASKEALVEEAIAHASERSLGDLDAACARPDGIRAYVQAYLSASHRDAPEAGCLMAALGPEIGREVGARTAFTRHLKAALARLEKHFPWRAKKTARQESIRLVAAMVGAIVLARAVDDEALSDEILREVRAGWE
ncbi:MAG TPA: helix-turn-helix domain-containing protein [Burkholderiaceae bacterium]|jgi:TetR/AcrR family transcriptional repressor of nem operon